MSINLAGLWTTCSAKNGPPVFITFWYASYLSVSLRWGSNSKIGFLGSFPTKYPEYFKSDFIIIGEPESFFLYQFYKNKKKYNGLIKVKKLVDMEKLPTPDFDGFPIKNYGYFRN